jgi:uncharacterized protein (UPF0261 family)
MRDSHGVRPTVLLIATLDTKSEEALYLKERIEDLRCSVLLMNAGILAPYKGPVDFDSAQVALAGGTDLQELQASHDKGRCIAAMREGVRALASSLYSAGRFTGVISIGGAQGTEIGTSAMRGLPFGVPKLMVSTVASGRATFGTYVDTRDLMLMHSVADLQGLNIITRSVLDNAASAICGMCIARAGARRGSGRGSAARSSVAVSMLGTTTPGALRVKSILERHGFEFVAFHQNGTGGIAMEDMIAEGLFVGVMDLNLHEIGDAVYGGLHGAIRDYRLETAGRMGIPQVVAPGSVNYTVQGPLNLLPSQLKGRRYIVHNPSLTLVRLSIPELQETARIVARRLNACKGPVHVFVPLRGFSFPDREGLPHWEPEGNKAFIDTLKAELDAGVPYDEIDAHINDPEFIDPVTDEFLAMVDRVHRR